jgi:tetratricopeptide (TPR) repeat protein
MREAMRPRFRAGAVALAAALLLPAGPLTPGARASDEDGGTESVFATGAGNRALAMGGAYTALADDASSVAWNPAGLGRLVRPELLASHASLYGLAVTDQAFAVAWPSWRWGGAALSLRRLGVSDIERRNERNVLLGDFAQSDLEIALGYGRRLNDAWHLGGTVKMHRQQIDEYTDSGLGLDLGALVHPALALGVDGPWSRRLTAGMTLVNVLAPTIRLDQTSVAEPFSFRMGTAYWMPFLGSGRVTGALDLEKPRNAALDLHAGLEVQPHPLLALRTGWSGDSFTAGAGVTWETYRFDYVYEDNDIDAVHRFGITAAFGATTAEKRLAARHAEDERFRSRLEETFERRRTQQVEGMFASAQEALDDGRLDEAGRAIETIRALAPDDARVVPLEAGLLTRRAELAQQHEDFADAAILWGRVLALTPGDAYATSQRDRCRRESNERAERSARIRELFTSALDAFTAGDLLGARGHLQSILSLAPDDTEAKEMLARTDGAITVRVNSLLDQARRAIDSGVLDAAGEHLAEAKTLDPSSGAIRTLEKRLRDAEEALQLAARRQREQQQVKPSPVVVKAPALSRKRLKEIEELYRSGMDAMREERADDALRYWELVWAADPDYQDVAEFLKREYLMRGLESFSSGGLDDAVRLWEKALQVDPSDERTLGYLSRAKEQLSRSNEILGGGAR